MWPAKAMSRRDNVILELAEHEGRAMIGA